MFLAITLYCYYKQQARGRRHAQTRLENSRLNGTSSVIPMTSGQDIEYVAPGKIIELLGRRVFTREIVTYGDAICVVCLSEYCPLRFSSTAEVCKTGCGHLFHCACLEEWLQARDQHLTCPL